MIKKNIKYKHMKKNIIYMIKNKKKIIIYMIKNKKKNNYIYDKK